jgi:hypothetical protein
LGERHEGWKVDLDSRGCHVGSSADGSRIVLQRVEIVGDARPDGRLRVDLTLVNDGYGRVIRKRPVRLAIARDGKALAKFDIPTRKLDLRTLASNMNETPSPFHFEFTLPRRLSSGPIALALRFRDPAPSLASQPAYALPLNSVDQDGNPVFDAPTGYNVIARFDLK